MRPNLEPVQHHAPRPEEPDDYLAGVDESRNPYLIGIGPRCGCTDPRCTAINKGGAGTICGARKLVPKGEAGEAWCARCGHHTTPPPHVFDHVREVHRRRMINKDRIQAEGRKK